MRDRIQTIFDNWIIDNLPNRDVANYLVNHERKDLCLDEVVTQIKLAELSNIGSVFNARKHKLLIEESARMFCTLAVKHKEEAMLSEIDKKQRIFESDSIKRAEEAMVDLEKEALDDKIKIYV